MANLLDGMDKVYSKLLPELANADVPVEHKATCLTCAMAPKPGADLEKPVAFTARARCCTYNPSLPNHVVGRILRRGDKGAERMRARIERGGGLSPFGVWPTAEWTEKYNNSAALKFGRSEDEACPYWADEAHGCTIWRDRNAVCRTWFCKHESAGRGRALWLDARDAISALDKAVAVYCAALGSPPTEDARPGEWFGWYRWCAERVDLFDAQDLERVRAPHVLAAVQTLIGATAPLEALPDVVVPNLLEWFALEDAMYATAYSAFDMDVLPAGLFSFLARLDGKRTWREALGEEPGVDEGAVRRMWERGLLAPPEGGFRAGSTSVAFREGPWSAVPELVEQIATSFADSLANQSDAPGSESEG